MIAFARSTAQQQSPDKERFHRYLNDFNAADESELIEQFSDCRDMLPSKYAQLLFLPPGSTYRDAVRLLLTSWNGTLVPGCDDEIDELFA